VITFLDDKEVTGVYYVVNHPTEGIIAMLNIISMNAEFVSGLSSELRDYALQDISSRYQGFSYDKQS
jgi:hypothetical protein